MDCSRKARFDTKAKADAARARYGDANPAKVAYKCANCGSWHNGLLPGNPLSNRQERRARWLRQTDTAMGRALRAAGYDNPLGCPDH